MRFLKRWLLSLPCRTTPLLLLDASDDAGAHRPTVCAEPDTRWLIAPPPEERVDFADTAPEVGRFVARDGAARGNGS